MLRLSFLIIFSILSLTFASYGQMCGGGTYRIVFVQKEAIKFELFSVTPKGMVWYSQEAKDWVTKNLSFFDEGINQTNYCVLRDKIKDKKAKEFIEKYKVSNFESIVGITPSETKLEGKSKNGIILFKTWETLFQPLILKISSKKYGDFYLFEDFLGGCRRTLTLDLNKNTKTLEY